MKSLVFAICFSICLGKLSNIVPVPGRRFGVNPDSDILVRALRGEVVERTPVWYLSSFRKYSDKYTFRERSETPDIAVELSLQSYNSFGVDGIIFFSDILTPLSAMNIEFTIKPGVGPRILHPIRNAKDVDSIRELTDIPTQLPFIAPILSSLSREAANRTSLIGFIGSPWTLAAYCVEGGHTKNAKIIKNMCLHAPQLAHRLLQKLTTSIAKYAEYQIECGVQVLQLFESWGGHLSEEQFEMFAKPYIESVVSTIKTKYPHVPVIYYSNGGSHYLKQQLLLPAVDAWSLDWRVRMKHAREIAGRDAVLCGNVDPMVLFGDKNHITSAVHKCIDEAAAASLIHQDQNQHQGEHQQQLQQQKQRPGYQYHVLGLGHGVELDTPESAVATFVEAAKNHRN